MSLDMPCIRAGWFPCSVATSLCRLQTYGLHLQLSLKATKRLSLSSIDFSQELISNQEKYILRAKSEPSDNLTKDLRALKFQKYIEENYPLGALAESSKFRLLSKKPEIDTEPVTETVQITTYRSILASDITPNKNAAIEAWLNKVDIDTGASEDLNEKSLKTWSNSD